MQRIDSHENDINSLATFPPKKGFSFGEIFKIFLKTGRKRVLLSILCGFLLFLVITSLCMIVYVYRYNSFTNYRQSFSWFNDGKISIQANDIRFGNVSIDDNHLSEVVTDFKLLLSDIVPEYEINNYTAAISAQIYSYEPEVPVEPWFNHEIMTLDDRSFTQLNNTLSQGRLARNSSEVVFIRTNSYANYNISDVITLYNIKDTNTTPLNFTIVGIIENYTKNLPQYDLSADVFDWNFLGDIAFYDYTRYSTFLMNYTLFQDHLLNRVHYFSGVMTYLLDIDYNLNNLKLSKLSSYINHFPSANYYPISTILSMESIVAPDLKSMLLAFSYTWVQDTTQILSLNAPLLIILGLITVVTLKIGSRELEINLRKMELYGINYSTIRRLIFLENLLISTISLIFGFLIGLGISAAFTSNIENKPPDFYSYFIQEPLLLFCYGGFLLSFFVLSFYIQNNIAKSATQPIAAEYIRKRGKIRQLFSTNEFRIFLIAFIFSIISISLYLLYFFLGPKVNVFSNLSFHTFTIFMIMFSVAFLITFVFLIFTRVINLFWTLVSENLWKKRINIFTLTLKHISMNKNSYQLAVLTSLIFGLLILPGIAMDVSIQTNLTKEANLTNGCSTIAILDWVDPEDKIEAKLLLIPEIVNFTEAVLYKVENLNEYNNYPKAFTINMLAIYDPATFLDIIDADQLKQSNVDFDDIKQLENDMAIFLDNKYAKKHGLKI
ncbi:MAG: FtsX-like permease family protein, partial [Candidatus Thorarchaeota archaeon]